MRSLKFTASHKPLKGNTVLSFFSLLAVAGLVQLKDRTHEVPAKRQARRGEEHERGPKAHKAVWCLLEGH